MTDNLKLQSASLNDRAGKLTIEMIYAEKSEQDYSQSIGLTLRLPRCGFAFSPFLRLRRHPLRPHTVAGFWGRIQRALNQVFETPLRLALAVLFIRFLFHAES